MTLQGLRSKLLSGWAKEECVDEIWRRGHAWEFLFNFS